MRIRIAALAVFALSLVAVAAPAWGQFNRTGRTGSSLGSTGMKSNSSGAFGTRSFGQGMSGNSRSFLGSSGTTSAGSARTSLGGASADQMLRSARGAANFVGADTRDTRNFLGYSSSATNSGLGSGSYGSSGVSGLYGSSSSYVNRYDYNYNRGGSSFTSPSGRYGRGTTSVRPSVDLGFSYAGPPASALAPKLAARLSKSPSLQFHQPVQVAVDNGTAVLRGVVSSEHQRALAEQLALLEPGIRRVDNRLTVVATPAESSSDRPAGQ